MKIRLLGTVVASLWLGVAQASANTVYAINDSVGTMLFLNGSITTDGKLGLLSLGDIVGWDLTISEFGQIFSLTDGNSIAELSGSSLSATSAKLLWDYEQHADPPVPTFFDFGSSSLVPGGKFGATVQYEAGLFGFGIFAFGGGFCPDNGSCDISLGDDRSGVQTIGNATPLPGSLPLFATGLCALGLMRSRRKRKPYDRPGGRSVVRGFPKRSRLSTEDNCHA